MLVQRDKLQGEDRRPLENWLPWKFLPVALLDRATRRQGGRQPPTIEGFLAASKRPTKTVPLRFSFVQMRSILNDLRLVRTERAGREIRAIKLREDGSDEPYRHPGEAPRERYMQLPFSYWLDDYFLSLDVPGKAVLMIAMTQGDWFSLPTRRGPEWYGLGRSTLERGFKNARAAKVIEHRAEFKEAPLAPEGYTRENFYRLLPPFGPRGVLAKSAHPIFSIEAAKLSPPPQTDKPKRRTKRRKPAAKTSQKEKTEATGAQREPRPRQPARSV